MNAQILLLLGQDGITNGAVYALLALSIVLVFAVTRVLFIPQGEFVTFGALAMGAIQAGKPTTLIWLVVAMAVAEAVLDAVAFVRKRPSRQVLCRAALKLVCPLVVAVLLYTLPLAELPMVVQALLTIALIVPMGPQIYRLFYQPIASASTLVLLIISLAVHLALVGLGLLIFGPQGVRNPPFTDAVFQIGPMMLNSQTIWVLVVSIILIVFLFIFFERTLYGKALRAVAFNRVGARLMGIRPAYAGKLTFFLAALIGTVSGILISPITTLYYDSGFVISLKGFVGSIIGGLASYPVAAAGALLVGLLESFSSFWASTYKEIIVFTLIIPFLLWRSLTSHHIEEEEDEE